MPTAQPFLIGRALWVASRLAPAIPAQHRAAYMQAAVAGLAPGSPAPVQIGACRALAQLCRKAQPHELAGVAPQMFGGLCQLLHTSTGERACHLVCTGALWWPAHRGWGMRGLPPLSTHSSSTFFLCQPSTRRRGDPAPGARDADCCGQGRARGGRAVGAANLRWVRLWGGNWAQACWGWGEGGRLRCLRARSVCAWCPSIVCRAGAECVGGECGGPTALH